MNYIKQKDFGICTISLRDDGIIVQRFLPETTYEVDAKFIRDTASTVFEFSEGKKVGILSITGLYGSMTTEAREENIFKSEEYTSALAIVITALSQRLLANFYFKVKKVDYPVSIFKTEEEAIEWLQKEIRLSKKAV